MDVDFFSTAAQVIPVMLLAMIIEGNVLGLMISTGDAASGEGAVAEYRLFRIIYMFVPIYVTAIGELSCFIALAMGAPVPWWMSVPVWIALIVIGAEFFLLLAVFIQEKLQPMEDAAEEEQRRRVGRLVFRHPSEQRGRQ
ncbi:hypothetical protein [Cryptosporangium aurantiacum]|uniref:Uncharacterized protein n=1 Tax=Cryptosporangium aurantiacum TaxID=134849 RepID=A0A1M7R3B9_9ACTN|nr:hypothetical protein [Cryptosporangium aurantiacum]SHN39464.1 hypothetical protein SAMN05443668_106289 [Cryptosporangium aurantiacum]